jgi:predicted CoA-binding protein
MSSIERLLGEGDPVVAVVGATDSPRKYGSIIYRDLKHKGFRVFGVNPYRDTVDGDASYRSLRDLPVAPDIVNIVVPPRRTLSVLEEAAELGYRRVLVQPGAADPAVYEYLDDHGFEYLADACIMVRTRVRT